MAGLEKTSTDQAILYLHSSGYITVSPHALGITWRIAQAAMLTSWVRTIVCYRNLLYLQHWTTLNLPIKGCLTKGRPPVASSSVENQKGGGLTIATTVTLREAGKTLPAALFCLSHFPT